MYMSTAALFLNVWGICIIPNAEQQCKPVISEGSHNQLDIGGHTTLQCDIAGCEVSKVIFEKKGIYQPTQWTPVFEGFDKTKYHALDTGESYTLDKRYDFSTFHLQHILYINPLTIDDQGEWRCVVYNKNNEAVESKAKQIKLEPQCKPELSEGSHSEPEIAGHITFECNTKSCSSLSKIIYEKTFIHQPTIWISVYEGVNKTHHRALEISPESNSLANRNDYTAFQTRHVLYIDPLMSQDQGRWRCVVYDEYDREAKSQAIDFYLVTPCKPDISTRSNSGIDEDATIACEIATCENISQIIYEKTFIIQPRAWVQVFEGVNKTYHRSLEDTEYYSLEHRHDYTAFNTRHILYINPLVPNDQGEWRCIVYDHYNRRAESLSMEFYMATSCKPELSGTSNSKLDGSMTLNCDIRTCGEVKIIIFEKQLANKKQTDWIPVYTGVNKTHHQAVDGNNDDYSLKDRTRYTAFRTSHVLYIDPLVVSDEGDWRCVVHDKNHRPAVSQTFNFMATTCKPEIFERSQIKPKMEDHATIECDISTCSNVSKVEYQKSGIRPHVWTPVYQGNHKTDFRALESEEYDYSLKKRADYAAFPTLHMLYIDPLKLSDQGEWRCVVYDHGERPTPSGLIDFFLATPCSPEIRERSYSKQIKQGYTSLECDITTCENVSRIIYEKKDDQYLTEWTPVYEGINNTEHYAMHTDAYSLRTRNDYTVFPTRHILFIDPLESQDQGEWRCVVYDSVGTFTNSNALGLNFGSKLRGFNFTDKTCKGEKGVNYLAIVIILSIVIVLLLMILAAIWIRKKYTRKENPNELEERESHELEERERVMKV